MNRAVGPDPGITGAMVPPERAVRARRLSSVLLASLLLCPALFAENEASQKAGDDPPEVAPYEGVDPGSVRDLDLKGGRITEALPFDVQFFFQAVVDDDLARASGRYLGSKERKTCEQLSKLFNVQAANAAVERYKCENEECSNFKLPGEPPKPLTPGEPKDICRKSGLDCDISFVRIFKDAKDGDKRKVELSVPAILPNRHYCFEFTLEDKVSDLEAFREEIQKEIDDELRGKPPDATLKDYNKLRQKLIDAIRKNLNTAPGRDSSKPRETLHAQPLSFFDPRSSLWDVEQNFLADFNDIVEAQLQRDTTITSLDSGRKALEDRLKALITDKAFLALSGSQDIRLEELEILRLTDGKISLLEQKLVKAKLEGVWDSDELEDPLQEIAALRQSLEALVPTVRRIGGDPSQLQFFSRGDSQLVKEDLQGLNGLMSKADFALKRSSTLLMQLQTKLRARVQGIEAIVEQLEKQLNEVVRIQGTTEASYETRAGWYLSADVGLGYAPDTEDVFTYIGTNIYFRPVNKKAPLRGSFLKRFSIMLGFTIDETTEMDADLQGVLMDRSLLLAGGIRVSDHFRLSLGTIVFEETNPDPLVSGEELVWSPFISASVDWNLRSLFKRVGGGFAK